ncbi:hypothetical protein [Vibrio sp. TRT 17S01]|uniref:hypothetical protein n=1 Tax=Vibrio sp. TRT 17S01 TaxID=3418505 RepID=UPI003CF659CD
MTLLNKKRQWIWPIGLVVLVGSVYWGGYFTNSMPPQNYIRIAGEKPANMTIKAWANYIASGDDCESYSYDMFGQKAHQGGKITTFFTQNFAEDDEHYELRVPYTTYTDSQNCIIELRDITVEAYNAFDSVGFAQLRIYQAGERYNNKPINLSSTIEARDCRARYYEDLQEWSSGLACSFYTNGKIKNKKSDTIVFNAYTVYFDFSQFEDETTITYNILAGENYRQELVNPNSGQQ